VATISEAMALAMEHHGAGRLEAAGEIYRRVTEAEPSHAEAWYLLGMTAYQRERHGEAVEAIGRAIALRPNSAQFYTSLGRVYCAQGRANEGEACFRQALEFDPDYAVAQRNLNAVLGRVIYPIRVPVARVQQELDFLLLHLPPFDGVLNNGLAYVHNALLRAGVRFQTVDANILVCHRYYQWRSLGRILAIGPGGCQIPDDLWGSDDHSQWERPEIVDFFWPEIRNLLEQIALRRPKAVGLSVHSSNRPLNKRFVQELRALAPEVLVVVGGYDCAHVESGPFLFPDFDYMAVFEADLTIGPLVKAIAQGERPKDLPGILSRFDTPGRAWEPAPLLEDLDSVDFPRYQWIDPAVYHCLYRHPSNVMPISASRGCNWSRCRFCEECFPFRSRRPMKVADELEEWIHRGAAAFYFFESDVNGDPATLHAICSEIIRRGLRAHLAAQIRVDKRSTLEYFQHLARAGFGHLRFGVDGWTDHILKLQRKGYNMELVLQNLRDCHAAGIRVGVNLVVGVPGETDEDVEETIENLVRAKDFLYGLEYVYPLGLRCASEYFRNAEQYKIFFRGGKEAVYRQRRDYVPEDLWYSEDPYIDQTVRTQRVLRICEAIRRRGVTLGPAAERFLQRLQNPGAFIDRTGEFRQKREA